MKKNIPLVDIRAQYEEIKDELLSEWEKSFESMMLFLGPNVRAFEKEFSEYIGVQYASGVDSGTQAVHFALKAAGVDSSQEVLLPSHTFFATPEAVSYTGAVPAFVDIDDDTMNISDNAVNEFIEKNCKFEGSNLIDKRTNKRVSTLLVVHLYGNPANMDALSKTAKKYGLNIVEDASQAHGAEFNGRKVGSFGISAGFSFYLSKNLSALGESGIVTTNNRDIKEKTDLYRVHGQTDKYTHTLVGYNARLDEIQAAVLRLKLKRLDKWNKRRREIAQFYTENLKDLPIKLPIEQQNARHVYHLYVIRTEKRDKLFSHLRNNGIGAAIHYPIPCHLQPALSFLNYKKGDLPITERASEQVLSIPVYPHMQDEDAAYVVSRIREFFR